MWPLKDSFVFCLGLLASLLVTVQAVPVPASSEGCRSLDDGLANTYIDGRSEESLCHDRRLRTDSLGSQDAFLLDNQSYLNAWATSTGSVPMNLVRDNSSLPTVARPQGLGPINGNYNYVALYYRNKRFFVTMVLVTLAPDQVALFDSFSEHGFIATAFATSARQIMGGGQGLWSSASWAYYNIANSWGSFTVVARDMLPRHTEYKEAMAAAKLLAKTYNLPDNIP